MGRRPDSCRAAVCTSVKWGSAPTRGLLQRLREVRCTRCLAPGWRPCALIHSPLVVITSPREAPALRVQKPPHSEGCSQLKPSRWGRVRVGGLFPPASSCVPCPIWRVSHQLSGPGGEMQPHQEGAAQALHPPSAPAPWLPRPAPLTEPGQQPCSRHASSYSRCFWVISPPGSDWPLHLPTSGPPVPSADRSARQSLC